MVRRLRYLLITLLLLVQYPLWFGEGSWLDVRNREQQLAILHTEIRQMEIRNTGMQAELRDLGRGGAAIEERARFDLGMIKPGEIFIRSAERSTPTANAK